MEVAEIELLRALVKTELEPLKQSLEVIKDDQKEFKISFTRLQADYESVKIDQRASTIATRRIKSTIYLIGGFWGIVLTIAEILHLLKVF